MRCPLLDYYYQCNSHDVPGNSVNGMDALYSEARNMGLGVFLIR